VSDGNFTCLRDYKYTALWLANNSKIFSSPKIKEGYETQATSYTTQHGRFLGVNWPWLEAENRPSIVDGKNAWILTATTPVRFLDVHCVNFNFTFT